MARKQSLRQAILSILSVYYDVSRKEIGAGAGIPQKAVSQYLRQRHVGAPAGADFVCLTAHDEDLALAVSAGLRHGDALGAASVLALLAQAGLARHQPPP